MEGYYGKKAILFIKGCSVHLERCILQVYSFD